MRRLAAATAATAWVASALLGCRAPNDDAADPDRLWLVGSGRTTGEITATTTEAALVRRFGAAHVERGAVGLGEGETSPGTILFADDSTRRLEILWEDTVASARPRLVQLHGSSSRWALPPGVSLGTTLAQIEQLNGRPFTLAGFGWDYGGTVFTWKGGRLDSLWAAVPARIIVRVAPRDSAAVASDDMGVVAGDREFPSDHPSMRRLRPQVYEIALSFTER